MLCSKPSKTNKEVTVWKKRSELQCSRWRESHTVASFVWRIRAGCLLCALRKMKTSSTVKQSQKSYLEAIMVSSDRFAAVDISWKDRMASKSGTNLIARLQWLNPPERTIRMYPKAFPGRANSTTCEGKIKSATSNDDNRQTILRHTDFSDKSSKLIEIGQVCARHAKFTYWSNEFLSARVWKSKNEDCK